MNLKERRKELGMSLRDVAAATKGRLSNPYISQLENGQIKSPSAIALIELAAVYGVTFEIIAGWLNLNPAYVGGNLIDAKGRHTANLKPLDSVCE